MRPDDLLKRLEDRPFRPFQIHISDGTTLTVSDPGDVMVGASTAMVFTRFGKSDQGRRIFEDWRTVALVHITQFSDVPQRRNGRTRRRSA